ncbi:MAG: SusD/RagB family nutrient-binding outer membrane lipoprotein [Cyclobacteriaceae bacterium]
MKAIKILSLSIAIIFTGACTRDFEDLQKNPNLPENVNPGLLLPSVILPAVNASINNGRSLTNEMMQYTASNNSFTEVQRFIFTLGNSNSVWNSYYGRMQDIQDIISLSEQLENPNYKAVGMIMRAWMFSILTDVFTDIPYSEAGKAISNSNFTPVYDSQQLIYEDLLLELKTANDMLVPALGLSFGGDILFNGDVMRWKKFANSLRLRLLMRVSNKVEEFASTEIKEMYDNPQKYPLFVSNQDHAVYQYSGLLPDVFPPYTEREFDFNNSVSSEFIIQTLKELDDPRLSIFFEPTKNSVLAGTPEYVGLPSGIPAGDAFEFNGGRDGQSLVNNSRFLNNARQKGIILSYAEVQFLLTEAAMRDFIPANPEDYYEAGIQASMAYWEAEIPDNYLQQEKVLWDGSYEKLFLQKYLSLFYAGLEAWFEYRRTGYPQIIPGPANVNDGIVPSRLLYPTIEQSLNLVNYQQAVQRIGGDNINSKGWWDSF